MTVMEIFTEVYSFGLNVLWGTNVLQDNLSSIFCGEQIEFITKICVCQIGCVGYLGNINVVLKLLHLAA